MKEQVKFVNLKSFQVFRYFLKYAENEEKTKLEKFCKKFLYVESYQGIRVKNLYFSRKNHRNPSKIAVRLHRLIL